MYVRIAQNGRLLEIPTNMPLRKSHLLYLQIQCNLPDLFAIALQSLFSQLAAIRCVALSNGVAGSLIDLEQGGWLIAEELSHFYQRKQPTPYQLEGGHSGAG